ncbi:NAD(P)/FAD-dependent oxidoreductase [Variovorax sp. VNK109]|uniref:NAD(P)/FAD-dependent oxidoreductase n=1 Tax=Variovorax sp. VNK109 TaxID=3400919 RepID=UPI003C020E6C
MREVDVAVIGAGVAGLTAAAAAARAGLQVLVIERMGAGGQVMTVEKIGNHPAYPGGISGFELGPALQEAAEDAGVEFMLDTVERLEVSLDGRHVVHGEGDAVAARAVLVAAGSKRRALDVPGEAALEGRGVSHCASCDGPLFRDEVVCVAGGGDSAVSEAALLARHVREVVLAFPAETPHAQPYLMNELAALPNVKLLPKATITAVEGDNMVKAVRLRTDAGEQSVEAAGVFVYAGLSPATDFLQGALALDAEGRIRTDASRATSVPGIFAAGDIRSGMDYTLAVVAADGEAAALAIHKYIGDKETKHAELEPGT